MPRATFSKFRSRWWAFCEIDRQLRHHRTCTAGSLARDLEVDPRSVRRYIAFMREELGAPIAFDAVRQSYMLTNTTWSMPNVHLSVQELQALAMALKSLSPTVPAPFTGPLQNLLSKMLDALPENQRTDVLAAQANVEFVPSPVRSKGDQWVEPLLKAIQARTSVDMTYHVQSKNRLTTRRFDPYHLRYSEGTWYVLGYDHHTKHWPVFNLARIQKMTVTEDFYRVRPFDAEKLYAGAFGIIVSGQPEEVQVRLRGYTAETAHEHIWPDGFTYRATGPSEGILSGKVAHTADLLRWISARGGEAELLPSSKQEKSPPGQ